MSGSDPLSAARLAWMRQDAEATIRAAQEFCNAVDPTIRIRALVLCGRAMHRLGHPGQALRLFQAARATNPNDLDTWTAIAELLSDVGETDEAIHAWQHVAVRTPRDPEPWLKLAEQHRAQQAHAAAASAVQRARIQAPHRADLPRIEALDRQAAGQEDEAHELILDSLKRFPQDVALHLIAAEGWAARGRREETLSHLDQAVSSKPREYVARSRRADFYMQSRRLEEAADDLAVMRSVNPNHAQGRLQTARLAMLRSEHAPALLLLDALIAEKSTLEDSNLGHALLYRAELHGKQGDWHREWADLTAGQAVLAQPQLAKGEDGRHYLDMVKGRMSLLKQGSAFQKAVATMPTDAPDGAALAGRPPVFMFGFPRSGTTLAERVLGAHPNLTATDELNLLEAVFRSIATECNNVPIEELSEAQVRHLRQVFVRKAMRAGYDPSTTRLIDKNPLNFVFIDVVRRVFPDAPVLMLLRDPRDCVWSAFRQAFEPNSALILTRDLAGAARLYRTVLDHWQLGRTIDGLQITEFHYEHLVTDFEGTARAMVAATGEAWDPAVLTFHQSLGHAYVRTPSFAAVGQKVTRGRVARWTPHANKMAAVLPILAPYIETYGVETVAPQLAPDQPVETSTES